MRVSDEVPVDESALDEALEDFQSTYHPAGETVSAPALDPDDPEDDPDLDRLDPDDPGRGRGLAGAHATST